MTRPRRLTGSRIKRGRSEERPKSREETPKEGCNTERDVRCCTAQFNGAVHKYKGGGCRGAMRHRLVPVTTNRLTRKGPALGRASSGFRSQRSTALGGVARLIGVPARLSLDDLTHLFGDADHQ